MKPSTTTCSHQHEAFNNNTKTSTTPTVYRAAVVVAGGDLLLGRDMKLPVMELEDLAQEE